MDMMAFRTSTTAAKSRAETDQTQGIHPRCQIPGARVVTGSIFTI